METRKRKRPMRVPASNKEQASASPRRGNQIRFASRRGKHRSSITSGNSPALEGRRQKKAVSLAPLSTPSRRNIFPSEERQNTSSQSKMSRWQPPHVVFERKNVFCMTKAQAHEVYNLNNSGQDPRSIVEEDFSDEDWLQVYSEVPKRGSKVKCKTVKKDFWPKFYTLFTSVYQEPPSNYGMEVTKAFARGFLYDHLRGLVNWVAFAASIVANMEAGKLHTKKQRWAAFHSPDAPQSSRRMTPIIDLDDCDASKGSGLHPLVRMQLGSPPLDHLDDVVALVVIKHENALLELKEVAMKLEGQKANLHRNEGAVGLIQRVTKQLEAARDRL